MYCEVFCHDITVSRCGTPDAPIIIVSRDKFENAMRNRTAKERLKNINQEDLFILFDEIN